jgi:predicted metal-dependent peptidase
MDRDRLSEGPAGDARRVMRFGRRRQRWRLQPFFPGLRRPRPLNLAIVVDCSGSMQGDSIAQARQAVARILDALQPQDRLTMIAFGTTSGYPIGFSVRRPTSERPDSSRPNSKRTWAAPKSAAP